MGPPLQPPPTPPNGSTRNLLQRSLAGLRHRTSHLPPAAQGMLLVAASGMIFSVLNALMRLLAQDMPAMQSQFLRYFMGLVVLAPWLWRDGLAAYKPQSVRGQFARGACHSAGLALWFIALPRIPLADMTAIGFTTPLFVMIGAYLFLGEVMRWERWLAAAVGMCGVLIVVGPQLSASGGVYHLIMLASAPMFAASFLITKALTRHERAGVILMWQAITVSLISLPLALWAWQWPSAWQWLGFLLCGVLGSAGHYALTKAFSLADISATQGLRFLDLVWSALMGWLIFADVPTGTTLIGGAVICTATIWIAGRESRRVN